MTPPAELVQPYGYPLEAHTVQTADGYLLGVFRMPRGPRSDAPATRRFAVGPPAWLRCGASTVPLARAPSDGTPVGPPTLVSDGQRSCSAATEVPVSICTHSTLVAGLCATDT